jgi:hypothetical protein
MMRHLLWIAIVLSTVSVGQARAAITSATANASGALVGIGADSLSFPDSIWLHIDYFAYPSLVVVDFEVDELGDYLIVEDGRGFFSEEFEPFTGIGNFSSTPWNDYHFNIELLESVAGTLNAADPIFAEGTTEVSNFFSNISGKGTSEVWLDGGTVPTLSPPLDGGDSTTNHLLVTVEVSLPVAGTYRLTQRPSVIPEPSTIAIWSLLGLAGLGVGWRNRRKAA